MEISTHIDIDSDELADAIVDSSSFDGAVNTIIDNYDFSPMVQDEISDFMADFSFAESVENVIIDNSSVHRVIESILEDSLEARQGAGAGTLEARVTTLEARVERLLDALSAATNVLRAMVDA